MVTIVRDTNGVPHVYGQTESDVAFGFGYAQAYDHLTMMLRNYMEATGRLCEIDGEAAVETDLRTRLWRTTEQAQEAYPHLRDATRTYLDAFVSGVNRYMENHPDEVPGWAEPVTEQMVVALYRLLHIRLNEWTMPELDALLEGGMSNQWAVAPERTRGNATICAMDPHVPWVSVFRMYEAHLFAGDGLNIYGAAPFGLPTIILGHTERHAWSVTINKCDVSDVFMEQLDPANPNRYRYQDQWRKLDDRSATLRVKHDTGFSNQEHVVSWSHHGPIVARDGDKAYAVRMSAYEIQDPVTPFLDMARAADLEEFKASLITLDIPMFNIVYGDKQGDIYYVYNERCPVRSEEFDWSRPVSGWTHKTEWQMYLPFNHLPQIQNPPAGFLQNCNNSPWYVTAGDVLSPSDFPSYAATEESNGRGDRVFRWLSETDALTMVDALDMVLDEYITTAGEMKPLLMDAWTSVALTLDDPTGLMIDAVGILTDWDNVGDVNSTGMTLFTLWKMHYDAMPESRNREDDAMVDALRKTVSYMIETYGRLEVPWGEVHVLSRGGAHFPVGGSSQGTEAIRSVRGTLNEDGLMVANYGSAFTMVVELGPTPAAWSLVPYGNSERPESDHYSDQSQLWSDRRLKRAYFTKHDVEKNASSKETLER